MAPRVTVLLNKYVRAWRPDSESLDDLSTEHEQARRRVRGKKLRFGLVSELGDALRHAFNDDAHFVTYIPLDADDGALMPRLKKIGDGANGLPALQGEGVQIGHCVGVLDVDCPASHADGTAAPDSWREDLDRAVADLDLAVWHYHTRGGARILWQTPEPLSPAQYEAYIPACVRWFSTQGIEGDKSCKDWTRAYRLPRVKRKGQPQRLPLYLSGDLEALDPPGWRPHAGADADPYDIFDGLGDAREGSFTLPEKMGPAHGEGRHDNLVSYAAQLRWQGMGEAAIYHALVGIDATRCEPPIADDPGRGLDELQAIATYVQGLDAAPRRQEAPRHVLGESPGLEALKAADPPTFPASDAHHDMAEWLCSVVEGTGPKLRWTSGALWGYTGATGIWAPYEPEKIEQMTLALNGCQVYTFREGGRVPMPWYLSDRKAKNVASAVCRVRNTGRWDFMQLRKPGLAFKNGFVEATPDGPVLRPHSPDNYAITARDCIFEQGTATPMWDAFMQTMFSFEPDAEAAAYIETIERFIGLSLLGKATEFQRAIVLVGREGANGKSTLLKLVRNLFRHEEVCTVLPSQMPKEYYAIMLQHTLMNIITEWGRNALWDTEAFKAAVTGDPISGRHPTFRAVTFIPVAGHLIAANDPPPTDFSEPMMRRLFIIPCRNRIPEEDKIAKLESIIMEAERPALYAKFIEAACRGLAEGGYPDGVDDSAAKNEWRYETDIAYRFFVDCCVPAPHDKGMSTTEIMDVYRSWCVAHGNKPQSSRWMGKTLKSQGLDKRRLGPRGKQKWRWPLRAEFNGD